MTDPRGIVLHDIVRELYPICRSITGDGVRATLDAIGRRIPLKRREVPTGTPVLDWTVPREWNIRAAWIANARGERIVDFARHNLHVVSYSAPMRRKVPVDELRAHLFSLPDHPDWIPYRTSYYNETWGFCVPHRLLASLTEAEYEVCIDATLAEGHLSYAEYLVAGESPDEVLISVHVCHPSLCNDNLSGIAVATSLAQHVSQLPARRYSYRFLFIPGTIGSIAWLAQNRAGVDRIKHGLVLTCVGDPGPFTYKQSRRGDAEIDRAVAHVLRCRQQTHSVQAFSPYGYDERQYCSPGFNLPVGCFMRSPHGAFPEYHTSADNLDFVTPAALAESLATLVDVVDVVEGNAAYLNASPFGEPQLGRRGLYQAIGGDSQSSRRQMTMLWVLNQSDGATTLLDIAEKAGAHFAEVLQIARLLEDHQLLTKAATKRS